MGSGRLETGRLTANRPIAESKLPQNFAQCGAAIFGANRTGLLQSGNYAVEQIGELAVIARSFDKEAVALLDRD